MYCLTKYFSYFDFSWKRTRIFLPIKYATKVKRCILCTVQTQHCRAAMANTFSLYCCKFLCCSIALYIHAKILCIFKYSGIICMVLGAPCRSNHSADIPWHNDPCVRRSLGEIAAFDYDSTASTHSKAHY